MVVCRILFDFGVVLGPVYISFLSSRSLEFHLFLGLFPGNFLLSIFESKFRRLGLPNRGFCTKRLFMEIVVNEFRGRYLSFLEALGAAFLACWALKTDLKIEGFW